MPSGNHNLDIVKNVRMIEALKAEMITELGELYQAMNMNRETAISESIVALIIRCYLLGKRLGIPFEELDDMIEEKLQRDSDVSEDVFKFKEYFKNRK